MNTAKAAPFKPSAEPYLPLPPSNPQPRSLRFPHPLPAKKTCRITSGKFPTRSCHGPLVLVRYVQLIGLLQETKLPIKQALTQ